jgi:predicted  nucleic acid-binding Zn-ribbon protein
MIDSLQQLIRLSHAMQLLAADTALLAGVPDEMRALHDEFLAERGAIARLEQDNESAALERRRAEGAIADAQEKLKHFQQQVARVRNQREYGALLTEIDNAKQNSKALEESALAALERSEELGRELAARREGFVGLEGRYQEALARWEAEKPEVARRAAERRSEVATLEEGIPRPTVAHLKRIFERYRGEVLSVLKRVERTGASAIWHCASCNYQIRAQVAVEIRTRGAIVQCEGCKRFLRPEESAQE